VQKSNNFLSIIAAWFDDKMQKIHTQKIRKKEKK
jgi:hypothetical protein